MGFRLASAFAALGFVLSFTACSESDTRDPFDAMSCEGETFLCQGDTLRICGAEGRLAYEPCQDVCAEQGLIYTKVCAMDEARGHDFCQCSEEGPCSDGATRCMDEETVEVCNQGTWGSVPCADFCEASDQETNGCGINQATGDQTCLCGEEKASICSPDYLKCAESPINPCGVEGLESFSCRERCEEEGLAFGECRYDTEQGELCRCVDQDKELCGGYEPTCIDESTVSVCVDGTEEQATCATLCDKIGLWSLGCRMDADRGFETCFCYSDGEEQSLLP